MTIAQEKQPIIIPENVIIPGSDLYSDEPPLESNLHLRQMMLLIECLEWLWQDRNDFFAAGNLTIYYSPNQKKSEDFKSPDFFVVLNTKPDRTRKSWVVWQEEEKYPDLIVEILSDSTAKTDRDLKKQLYQDTFQTSDYFWFDPYSLEFAGFHLVDGKYQPIEPNEFGYLWSDLLKLYLGVYEEKLRYFTADNSLVPTPEEAALWEKQQKELAQQEKLRAEQEKLRAEQEKLRAEQEKLRFEQEKLRAEQEKLRAEQEKLRAEEKNAKLAAKLRELNIDPDSL